MNKKLLFTGVLSLILACSSDKQDGFNSQVSTSGGSSSKTTSIVSKGGSGGSSIGGVSSSTTSINSGGSLILTSGTLNIGGATGTTSDPVASGGSTGITADPPNLTGGTGSTADPPTTSGGVGNTQDPVAGKGNTADPVGGSGNTADPAGGSGNTADPVGGSGNTADPVGGKGNTNDPPDVCVPDSLGGVNVIVFEDAAPSGADSEGGMYVGGNFSTTGSYSIGAGSEAGLTCDDFSFVVDGNISGTAIVKVGQAAYGGELIGSIDATCGAYDYPNPNGLTVAPVDFAKLESDFIFYSNAYKNYAPNGTTTLQWSTLTFSGSGSSLYVFNITAAQLMSATSIVFKVETTASVIVNVSGLTINWSNAGFTLPDGGSKCKGTNGVETGCERILWNFYEATSIVLSGIGVQGTILAPYATQSGAGGNVDGQVIVKYLTGGIEYHPYYFNGCLLSP
jgi:choice-of-anchor A domain-containing protein